MAGTILTPTAIWSDFSVNTDFNAEIVSEKKSGDVVFSNVRFDGKRLKDGTVRISGVMASNVQQGVMPAILLVQDFNTSEDVRLIKDLAKRGYTVLSVDVSGKEDGKEEYTVYPESISYANYQNVKDNLYYFEGDANHCCWYEWSCVLRSALAYLKSIPSVTKVGAFGIGEAATALWSVAGTDDNLDATVFAINAGWTGYRGINKFGGMVEPQFSDDMYKYVAGVDPQAYAMHIKRPVLMLSPTNSNKYDCDRAYDTLGKISKEVYKAINYSVGYRQRVSGDAYRTALTFFENFLMKESSGETLVHEVDLKCDTAFEKLKITVNAEEDDLKELAVYISEQTANPEERCWHKISDCQKTESGFEFYYSPYFGSGMVTAFAVASYKCGMTVGSRIINKKFTQDEVSFSYKSNIIYSSRILNSESVFSAARQDEVDGARVNLSEKKRVVVKKGPMGIYGVNSEWGLLTFKVNAEKDKPSDGAMLMLDAYSKNGGTLTVKLISDYFGNKNEYSASAVIPGGEIWHNFKFERGKFKTAEGMTLKSYLKIDAMEFSVSEEDYLINNALWV